MLHDATLLCAIPLVSLVALTFVGALITRFGGMQ